jgi:hypothetical protein
MPTTPTIKDAHQLAVDAANLGAGNLALGLVGVAFLVALGTLAALGVFAIRALISGAQRRGDTDRAVWVEQLDKLSTRHENAITTLVTVHREDHGKLAAGLEKLTDRVGDMELTLEGIRPTRGS